MMPFKIPGGAALALMAVTTVGCAPSQSKGPESEPPNTAAPNTAALTATPTDSTKQPDLPSVDTPNPADTAPPAASTPSKPVEPGEVAVPGASASAWHTSQSDGKPDKGDRGIRDYQRIVQENRDKFRACYDAARGQGSNIRGKVTLVWTLDPRGDLREGASIDRNASDFYDEFLEKCMVGALKQLTFPPSRRGLDSTVRYPFDFKPQGKAPR